MTSTYLVIGASTGLGRETARALARDHRVVTAGRHPEADVKVDLRSLADVARAAGELRKLGPFAGVVCNAGVQTTGEPIMTTDQIEETFAVNHLAHVAMVVQLELAPGTRVALIGSGTVDPDDAGARRFGYRGGRYTSARELAAGVGDPEVSALQNARDRYATSKLCNLLTVQALAKRGLTALAFDPGLMPGTNLARNYNLAMRIAWSSVMKIGGWFMRGASTAKRSGASLAWLMTTPDVVAGAYYDFHRRVVAMPAVAQRADEAEELYTTSLALAGLTHGDAKLAPAM